MYASRLYIIPDDGCKIVESKNQIKMSAVVSLLYFSAIYMPFKNVCVRALNSPLDWYNTYIQYTLPNWRNIPGRVRPSD